MYKIIVKGWFSSENPRRTIEQFQAENTPEIFCKCLQLQIPTNSRPDSYVPIYVYPIMARANINEYDLSLWLLELGKSLKIPNYLENVHILLVSVLNVSQNYSDSTHPIFQIFQDYLAFIPRPTFGNPNFFDFSNSPWFWSLLCSENYDAFEIDRPWWNGSPNREKYEPLDSMIKIGSRIDACDCYEVWSTAEIIRIMGDNITVQFDNWPPNWNESIKINSWRIAPPGTFSYGHPDSRIDRYGKSAFERVNINLMEAILDGKKKFAFRCLPVVLSATHLPKDVALLLLEF